MSERGWSALDDARLMALAVLGVPQRSIAILIGRRNVGVISVRLSHCRYRLYPSAATALRPRGPRWPNERIEALERLLRAGLSRRRAARRMRVSVGAVSGVVTRHLPHLIRRNEARP